MVRTSYAIPPKGAAPGGLLGKLGRLKSKTKSKARFVLYGKSPGPPKGYKDVTVASVCFDVSTTRAHSVVLAQPSSRHTSAKMTPSLMITLPRQPLPSIDYWMLVCHASSLGAHVC
jgi:hypothetical protein